MAQKLPAFDVPRQPLVLLPGMLCDERLFEPQISAFEAEYDIMVGRLTGFASVEGLAENLLARMPKTPFNLLGLSMGGIVAMEMVRQNPDRIKRLALLDTNHLADSSERRRTRNRQIELVISGRLEEVIIDEMKPNYLGEKNKHNQALLDLLVDMAVTCGADVFLTQSIALRDRKDQSQTLRKYRGKTLVLCGEEDALCPPETSAQIADLLKNSTLVIVPETGHISTLEAPDAVNRAVANWLGD